MQQIAARVFVISSTAFGLLGILFFLGTFVAHWGDSTSEIVFAIWGVSGSIVLSSFALTVAGKYLLDKPLDG